MHHYVENREDFCRGKSCSFSEPGSENATKRAWGCVRLGPHHKHLILGNPAQPVSLMIFQGFADAYLEGFLGNQTVRCHTELESFGTPGLAGREDL
jgi:hypothetical protein